MAKVLYLCACEYKMWVAHHHSLAYVYCGFWTGTVETIECVLYSLDERLIFAEVMRKIIEFFYCILYYVDV